MELRNGAIFSSCESYRYQLTRAWPDPLLQPGHYARRPVVFIVCNPSTADATSNDSIILRCESFARAWGYAGLVVVSLYAWRATNPRELGRAPEPVGPENDAHIRKVLAGDVGPVIAAWGALSAVPKSARPGERIAQVVDMVTAQHDLAVIRFTQGGAPEHPLYLPSQLKPLLWHARRPL